jgi:predicted dehydrogenase
MTSIPNRGGNGLKPLGVAVVGAGYWGPNLVRNLRVLPEFDLAWVCDLSRERAQEVVGPRSTVRATDALEDVLSDPEIAAVAVATPAATHAEVVLACLEAGKHVLVEKPLAASVAEGEKLVLAAEQKGLVLMCDHTYCYTPAVAKVRELARSGALGAIQYFDSVRINLGLVQRDIDVFWDLAPHDLSILDFVLPDDCVPETVAAQGVDPIGAGHACVGYLTLRLSTGGIAHVHVNWLSPTKVRTTIIGGSERIVVWDDLNPTQRVGIYDKGVQLNGSADSEARREALVSYRTGDMVAPVLAEVEALGGALREFAAAIRERRPALTDGASGLRVLKILEAVPRSVARDGASVSVQV